MMLLVMIQLAVGQGCFSLQGSKHCAGLENFGTNKLILAILNSTEFSNVAQLDAYMDKNSFRTVEFQQSFQKAYNCPGFKGSGGRFIDSTQCAYFVQASAKKCQESYKDKSTVLNFCSTSCEARMVAFQAIFQDKAVCDPNPTGDSKLARELALSPASLNGFCPLLKETPASIDGNRCFSGVKLETDQCGISILIRVFHYTRKGCIL